MDRARNVALKVLYEINVNGAYANIALDEQLRKCRREAQDSLSDRDVGFISELVYGVTTWRLTLDVIIRKYSKIRVKKISGWILNILRMGVYQIVFLDRVPKSAAVDESVKLAKRYGHKSSAGFVNAILRKIEKSDFDKLFEIKDDVERISKTTSMPEWIVKKLLEKESVNEVERICKASNAKPNLSVRINRLKTTKLELEHIFENENIEFEEALLDNFLYINHARNIEGLKSFKDGLFTVQDEVASLPSLILNPKKGEKILDACSAPGGKTTYLAELSDDGARIEAWDIHEHRTRLVQQNAERLNIKSIKTKCKDATVFDKKYVEQFDKILLDVPCLGLGVLKGKPDIKWQRNESDVEKIVELQFKILEICSKYLKRGGTLVYSTCSILREENEVVIEKFLAKNKNFEIEKIELLEQNYFEKFVSKRGFFSIKQSDKNERIFCNKVNKKINITTILHLLYDCIKSIDFFL